MERRTLSLGDPDLNIGELYDHPPLARQGRADAVERFWAEYQDKFTNKAAMVRFLDSLSLPSTGAWAYARIPKTGTHSVLDALHQLEFGYPLTTKVTLPNNISSNMAPHMLDEAGVFMSPLQSHHTSETLRAAMRFTVIREPVARAMSSFRYLCKSHELASRQLAPVRLRLTAMTGFNWDTHVNTPIGLEKMVIFVAESLANPGFKLDRHIAPQSTSLPRDFFQPYMTGRTEELPRFLDNLADEFGIASTHRSRFAMRNAATGPDTFAVTRRLRQTIEDAYAEDVAWYGSL